MSKQEKTQQQLQRFSLAARLSGVLVLAVILPLVITVVTLVLLSRPSLVDQTSKEMQTDARTRTQLIDNYMAERILETEAISRLPSIQQFLAGAPGFQKQAREGLATGHGRGSYYDDWSLFDLQGNLRLYYPAVPQIHGSYFIVPGALQQLQTTKRTLFSDVFYNPVSNEAYIDLYSPVVTPSYTVVGVVRNTFDLHAIWQIVNDDANANGQGSYAFILDENGVRIAATSFHPNIEDMTLPPLVFTAIAPLSPALQQRISAEELYGISGQKRLTVLPNPALATFQQQKEPPANFQMTPSGQHEMFQVVRQTTYTVPWSYFVLSPLRTVTSVADDQLHIAVWIAAIVLVLAILLGVLAGRRFAQPIARSLAEQRRAYEHQQRLSRLKDQFLVNVSHELRTPLTEIYGYLELLLVHGGQLDSSMRTTFLTHAMSGCEELKLLVNNVLDAVHLDKQMMPPQRENVVLARIVNDVLMQFDPRTIEKYEVRVQVPETLSVRADPQYLRQVLRNLLSNAFKYAPTQTAVIVSALRGTDGPLAMVPYSHIGIYVKDHGPGIVAEDIPLLFEKFVRLKRDLSGSVRGTGLGLYISKRLVAAMGGVMWVESSGIPGHGSCFCFTLPVAINEPGTAEQVSTNSSV